MRASLIITLLVSGIMIATLANADTGDQFYVEVNKSKLRKEPKHWAAAVVEVEYGDSLQEISREGKWVKVKKGEDEGYIHETALTKKRVILKKKSDTAPASTDESDIVLAGKGFNDEIETQYREGEEELNYEAVDQVEQLRIEAGELEDFVKEGHLNTGENNAQTE